MDFKWSLTHFNIHHIYAIPIPISDDGHLSQVFNLFEEISQVLIVLGLNIYVFGAKQLDANSVIDLE